MKKLVLMNLGLISLPILALAQNWTEQIPDDGVAYASIFAGNFSLLLSVVIGAIATFIVFRSAKKFGGGIFGTVLNYIGFGMLLIVIGTISTVVEPWFVGLGFNVVATVFFALGYIFTVIGANKLLRSIMTN